LDEAAAALQLGFLLNHSWPGPSRHELPPSLTNPGTMNSVDASEHYELGITGRSPPLPLSNDRCINNR